MNWLAYRKFAAICAWAATTCLLGGQPASSSASSDADALLARFGRRDARVHDPSTVVKCKAEYWVFATGMGILTRHSGDLLHWTNGPPVFTHPASWATNAVPRNRGYFWAPDIICLSNRYLLYYSVSSFGKNISAIGVAGNQTLDPADPRYAWVDGGPVVQSTPADSFNAIDPCVTMDAGGNLWLAFGSFWSGIKLVQLDALSGRAVSSNAPFYSLAYNSSIEAACIYRKGEQYFLFVNWGLCCRGVKSTYNIRVGRSSTITGPYRDKAGKDLLAGGGSLVLETHGAFIGPGHAGILVEGDRSWLSCHFYDGTRNGTPSLALLPLRWSADGWPQVEPD